MRPACAVRDADVGDRAAIVEVIRSAFATGGADGSDEVDIAERTWASGVPLIDLVAVDPDGSVIGHVLAATARVGDVGTAMGVAPVSVMPNVQGIGVGSALMTTLVERARAGGVCALALLGNPTYYGRFGFVPSGPLGVHYEPVGRDSPYFQVLELTPGSLAGAGRFTYCFEDE